MVAGKNPLFTFGGSTTFVKISSCRKFRFLWITSIRRLPLWKLVFLYLLLFFDAAADVEIKVSSPQLLPPVQTTVEEPECCVVEVTTSFSYSLN